MVAPAETRKIVIEPVTRVEGHGKVTILLDEKNKVKQARLHIAEFRGFERYVRGRSYWEMPVLVQRLCGICPVSHHLCAAKAMDQIVGVDHSRFVNIAQCDRLGIFQAEEALEVHAYSMAARANKAHRDSFAGSYRAIFA